MFRSLRDEQRSRKSQNQTENRRHQCHAKRPQQDDQIKRINQPLVILQRPRLLHSAISPASQEAVAQNYGKRRREESCHPHPGWQDKPRAQFHATEISSEGFQLMWTDSPFWGTGKLRWTCATASSPLAMRTITWKQSPRNTESVTSAGKDFAPWFSAS